MALLGLSIDGLEPALSVRRFAVREAASELFDVTIIACSPCADVDLDDVVLRPASFAITAGWAFVRDGGSRSYSGLCASIEQVQAEPTGLSTYAIRLVPRLWLLTLNRDYRIFQGASIPAIVGRLLDERSIGYELRVAQGAHPALDYKVQYGESDFAFVCRLCEEAGITFTFRSDDDGASILVLDDAPCDGKLRDSSLRYIDNPNEASEQEFVTRVRARREGRAGAALVRDYDFRHPALPLVERSSLEGSVEARIERSFYEPGSFRAVVDMPTTTPVADAAGVARHEPSYGRRRAERAVNGDRAGALTVSFETDALDLAPGTVFSIAGHPHPRFDEKQKLLVTELALFGEHDKEWRARGRAVLAEEPYAPPQRTPKPVIHGIQSAIVTGPRGREIFTDEYGRVRVQFPWDREGRGDDRSSCWIRVSQGWAGAGFGLWALPRVGQEVLVAFLAGDPDEPIIVGRAPNAHNPPPYPLPAHETKTVLRSRSTPGGEGFNEISFEDKKGEERFYERAEKDKETFIKSDERLVVGRNRQKLVRSDEDVVTLGARRELLGGSLHLTIKAERREAVEGSESRIVGGDRNEVIDGRYALETGGAVHIVAGGPIVLEAPDITLKGAGGFVHIGSGGVEIDGGAVLIKQGGSPGSGAGSDPAMPDTPTIPCAFVAWPMPQNVRRLPVFGGLILYGADPERALICRAICACDNAHNGTQRVSQWCVTLALWEYDKMHGNQSTIKADVPFDMSKNPPVPIMSKNDPTRPKHKKDAGTTAPDVVVVYDGAKPPTQANIKKVYEIKFGNDALDEKQRKAYTKIAGAAEFETLTPGTCGCDEEEIKKLPEPIGAKEAALLVLLVLAFIAAVLDGVPGDEVAAGASLGRFLGRLWPRLAPILLLLLSKLSPVYTPPMLPPL